MQLKQTLVLVSLALASTPSLALPIDISAKAAVGQRSSSAHKGHHRNHKSAKPKNQQNAIIVPGTLTANIDGALKKNIKINLNKRQSLIDGLPVVGSIVGPILTGVGQTVAGLPIVGDLVHGLGSTLSGLPAVGPIIKTLGDGLNLGPLVDKVSISNQYSTAVISPVMGADGKLYYPANEVAAVLVSSNQLQAELAKKEQDSNKVHSNSTSVFKAVNEDTGTEEDEDTSDSADVTEEDDLPDPKALYNDTTDEESSDDMSNVAVVDSSVADAAPSPAINLADPSSSSAPAPAINQVINQIYQATPSDSSSVAFDANQAQVEPTNSPFSFMANIASSIMTPTPNVDAVSPLDSLPTPTSALDLANVAMQATPTAEPSVQKVAVLQIIADKIQPIQALPTGEAALPVPLALDEEEPVAAPLTPVQRVKFLKRRADFSDMAEADEDECDQDVNFSEGEADSQKLTSYSGKRLRTRSLKGSLLKRWIG